MAKVNCAARPASLIESVLFGHVRGAFAGALADKLGPSEVADNGTSFLDRCGRKIQGAGKAAKRLGLKANTGGAVKIVLAAVTL